MSTETTEETTVHCSVCGVKSAEDPCSDECWENMPCTHEESEWGSCIACGADTMPTAEEAEGMNLKPYYYRVPTGCAGRGWYHDGSEDYEASLQNRETRPCPSCGGK